MKKVIISSYWTIAVLLISLVVMSLGYTFPESLFIAATFLPGAFFSLYFPENFFREPFSRSIFLKGFPGPGA